MILKPFLKLFLLLLASLVGIMASAQPFCPPNLNFENGNLGNWRFYTGNCCPINTPTITAPLAGRHDLTFGSAVDPYGFFPIVGSGVYSLKLGNSINGAQAEKARYYIHVPSVSGQYILMFRYAVVLEDAGHNDTVQPRFEVRAFDSITNVPLPCNEFVYVASANLPGFQQSTVDPSVYFKSWATATIDLSAYTGTTVAVEFTSADCGLGGHFGYGYVDMNCGFFQIQPTFCDVTTTHITLNGPPGYQGYKWYNGAMTTLLGTSQILVVPTPSAPTTYALTITPYAGYGCPDTFFVDYYTAVSAKLDITAGNDTAICSGTQASLKATFNNNFGPFTYQWSPASGLGCKSCPGTPASLAGTYKVVVTNANGCVDSDEVTVTVNPTPVATAWGDTTICGKATALLYGSGGGTYAWSPSINVANPNSANTSANPATTTTFKLAVTNTYGCSDTDTVRVVTKPLPPVNAGPDISFCIGKSAILTGSGGVSYQWLPNTNITNAHTATPHVYPVSTTVYKLIATGVNDCRDTDDVVVTVHQLPVVNAGPDTGYCMGTMTGLDGRGSDIGDYIWSPLINLQYPTWIRPQLEVLQSMTYTLAVTSPYGCIDSDKVTITAYPNPVANAGADVFLCDPDTVTLNGSGSGTYLWTPAADLSDSTIVNPTVYIDKSRSFQLKVTSPMGCSDSDQVSIGLAPLPVFTVTPEIGEVCPGVGMRFHANGGVYYKWEPATGLSADTGASPFVRITENMTYRVHIVDMCGKDTTISVSVKMKPDASIVVDKPNDIDCGYDEVKLTVTGALDYNWSPSLWLDDPFSATPIAKPEETIEYTVIGTNKEGCHDTAKVTVGVNKAFQLGMPNAFSPDGDGSNDCFRFLVKEMPMQYEISVFNRWGNLVFQSTNINECWDGTYNGVLQPEGVYVYYSKLFFEGCKEMQKTGNVTLFR